MPPLHALRVLTLAVGGVAVFFVTTFALGCGFALLGG